MNRLSNYFDSAKLCKLLLGQADRDLTDGKIERSIRNVMAAQRELLTAMNNVASIGFNSKPKGRK